MSPTNRRQFIKIASAGVGTAALAGCMGDGNGDDDDTGSGDSDEYPPSSLTFVNAYSEGGGVDTNF